VPFDGFAAGTIAQTKRGMIVETSANLTIEWTVATSFSALLGSRIRGCEAVCHFEYDLHSPGRGCLRS